jgi:hypothetical protein
MLFSKILPNQYQILLNKNYISGLLLTCCNCKVLHGTVDCMYYFYPATGKFFFSALLFFQIRTIFIYFAFSEAIFKTKKMYSKVFQINLKQFMLVYLRNMIIV